MYKEVICLSVFKAVSFYVILDLIYFKGI